MESLANLLQKQEEISTKIETLRKQKKDGLAEIVALVEKYQLTPAEISAAMSKTNNTGKKRGKVPPKYRDPATGVTWTGRGKAPAWIAGKNREPFLIKN